MKIEITESCWIDNKPVEPGAVFEAEGLRAEALLKHGKRIDTEEVVSKTPEYETKVIIPKRKGMKK